ncbi:GntR family transcriptional regulator [Smaragdicoccus niigatensis]|uniref:GntR family transcriptional regulator n=1 Tax=Smaragdicoccus niigatensis TaxID=359359 RepID=UPI00037234FD|nr:GntR family transcriptional regulator [Smaragdicoccus niigatensis]
MNSVGLSAISPIDRAEFEGDLAQWIVAVLEDAILRRMLQPGDRLNADALSKQLGVSHIPVREALRVLAARHWIEIRRHQGAFVTSRTAQELSDLFEVRLCVEPYSARLGATRRSSVQVDELEEIVAAQRRTDDPVRFAELNAEFHTAIAGCSQNEQLTRTVSELGARARFYFSPAADLRHDRSINEHCAILRAVRNRDPESAESLTFQHIDDTRLDVLALLRADGS